MTAVSYEPDAIRKRFVRARIDPNRVRPPTGPEPPVLDVEWRFDDGTTYYRIHYADPNTGFNCGWHRDDDHAALGPVHFQYERPETGTVDHESAQFSKTLPTEICWEAVERVFEDRCRCCSTTDTRPRSIHAGPRGVDELAVDRTRVIELALGDGRYPSRTDPSAPRR